MKSNIFIAVIIILLTVYGGILTYNYISTQNKLEAARQNISYLEQKLHEANLETDNLKQLLDEAVFKYDSLLHAP